MLALTDATGQQSVLRLMTNEPWRNHGAELTRRERTAQEELASTQVPAPTSIAVDAEGSVAGVAAHLMSRLPGTATREVDAPTVAAMVEMLALIHDVKPAEPFRTYQSWAWEAKWAIPPWTKHPGSWQRAFDLLAEGPPSYAPTFLHRDYSHRNLLWRDGEISGVVDWVETSSGPVWLDAGHAATNLALACGPEPANAFLAGYAAQSPGAFKLVGGTFSEENYGIGLKKGDTELLNKINDALKKMEADGAWAAAFEKNLGPAGVETPAPPAIAATN